MTQFEIWLLAFGLAMDCFTISIASGIIQQKMEWRTCLLIAIFFGLFQGIMPLLGWGGTVHFRSFIESFDHWIAFVLLVFLGGKMIIESFQKEEHHHFNPAKLIVILTLAVATSIDALAVGISFTCIGLNTFSSILYPILIIGITSSVLSFIGYIIGINFGKRFRIPVEPIGGLILIVIGCRILCEHIM